jgi:hypothetical protein
VTTASVGDRESNLDLEESRCVESAKDLIDTATMCEFECMWDSGHLLIYQDFLSTNTMEVGNLNQQSVVGVCINIE